VQDHHRGLALRACALGHELEHIHLMTQVKMLQRLVEQKDRGRLCKNLR
jgi:hypothetical protein